MRRAQQAVDREKDQARQSNMQTAISIGATLLGALGGRKTASRSNVGRASTAMRGVSRSMNQKGDVQRAEDTVESLQKQMQEMEAEFKAQVNEISVRLDPASEELTILSIRPKKADIVVQMVALAWAPYWQDEQGNVTPAF